MLTAIAIALYLELAAVGFLVSEGERAPLRAAFTLGAPIAIPYLIVQALRGDVVL